MENKHVRIAVFQMLMLPMMLVFTQCFAHSVKNTYPLPKYSKFLAPDELKMAKKAFHVFVNRCNPLFGKYADDIESISISSGFDTANGCFEYRCEKYGWTNSVYVRVKIKDKTKIIPDVLMAWGHTLHFYLGGPTNPGITTSKRPQLCGVERPEDGSDTYIPESKLSFIKLNNQR